MIAPIIPTSSINLHSRTTDSQKTYTNKENKVNIEWYCNLCERSFEVPQHIPTHKKQPDYRCPYCGGKDIINNRNADFKEKLCQKI